MGNLTPRTPTTTFSSTTRTTMPLDVPAGTTDGDLMLAFFSIQNATDPGAQTDWNTILTVGATALSWGVYWRWASSEPASYNFSHASARDAGIMISIPGVDSTTPIITQTGNQQGTGNRAFDAINPGSGVESVIMAFLAMTEGAPDQAVVSGTNCDSIVGQESSEAGGGVNAGVAILQEYLASGGSFTPTYTIATGTLTRSGTISIALKPAPSGTNHTAGETASAGLADASVISQGHQRSVIDLAGLADAATPSLGHVRTVADPLGLADTSAVNLGKAVAVTDALGLADIPTFSTTHTRADLENLSDAATIAQDHVHRPTDAAGLADTSNVSIGRQIAAADAMGLSDNASVVLMRVHSVDQGDSMPLADATVVAMSHVRTVADTLTLLDTATVSEGHTRNNTDALGLADAAVLNQGHAAVVGDSTGLNDLGQLVAAAYHMIVGDQAGLIDNVTLELAQLIAEFAADSAGLSDSAVADLILALTVQHSDSMPLVDSFEIIMQLLLTEAQTDTLNLLDSSSRALGMNLLMADTLSLSDLAVLSHNQALAIVDALGLDDVATVGLDVPTFYEDLVNLGDSFEVTIQLPYSPATSPIASFHAEMMGGQADIALVGKASLLPDGSNATVTIGEPDANLDM